MRHQTCPRSSGGPGPRMARPPSRPRPALSSHPHRSALHRNDLLTLGAGGRAGHRPDSEGSGRAHPRGRGPPLPPLAHHGGRPSGHPLPRLSPVSVSGPAPDRELNPAVRAQWHLTVLAEPLVLAQAGPLALAIGVPVIDPVVSSEEHILERPG